MLRPLHGTSRAAHATCSLLPHCWCGLLPSCQLQGLTLLACMALLVNRSQCTRPLSQGAPISPQFYVCCSSAQVAAGRHQLPAVGPLGRGALRALPGHSCAARSFAALPHTFRMRFRTPFAYPPFLRDWPPRAAPPATNRVCHAMGAVVTLGASSAGPLLTRRPAAHSRPAAPTRCPPCIAPDPLQMPILHSPRASAALLPHLPAPCLSQTCLLPCLHPAAGRVASSLPHAPRLVAPLLHQARAMLRVPSSVNTWAYRTTRSMVPMSSSKQAACTREHPAVHVSRRLARLL